MKAKIITLTILLSAFLSVNAQRVILNPTHQDKSTEHNKLERSPIRIPSVYLEDTTLSFEASCIGCTITLLQNHNAVFTAIIDEDGIVVLPDYLFGVYELQLQFGSLTFVGEIEL